MKNFLTVFFCILSAVSDFAQKPITSLLETDNYPILKYKAEIRVGGFGEYI